MSSISKSAEHAVDRVKSDAKDARAHARGALLDFATQVLKTVATLRSIERRTVDSALDRVGLQRRQSGWVPLMWFAGGAVVAGGVVLAFAPASGRELRTRLARLLEGGAAGRATEVAKGEAASKAAPATAPTGEMIGNGIRARS